MPAQREHELLHLHGGGHVRAEHAARLHHLMQRAERAPRLRQVQDASVEPIIGARNVLDISVSQFELIGELPEERLDVLDGLIAVIGAQVVRDDASVGPRRAAQRDRERARNPSPPPARATPGKMSAYIDDRARGPSDTPPARPAASSTRSPRTGDGTPSSPCPSRSRRACLPACRAGRRAAACRCACDTSHRPAASSGTCGRADPRASRARRARTRSRRAPVDLRGHDLVGELGRDVSVCHGPILRWSEPLAQDLRPRPAERAEPARWWAGRTARRRRARRRRRP